MGFPAMRLPVRVPLSSNRSYTEPQTYSLYTVTPAQLYSLVQIVDKSGTSFKAWLRPAPEGADDSQVTLQLTDGTQFLVPHNVLIPAGEGRFELSMSLRDYARGAAISGDVKGTKAENGSEDTVIPIVEETLRVDRRTVERGVVQLHKRVVERQETVDVPLQQERIEIERVSINRVVSEAAPVRQEGDTMIVPLFEEVLAVSKQLMLVEEVRITTQRTERREQQQVTLRREEVSVGRKEDEGLE